jgi:Carboxypeptidase regulatory-like domain
MRESRADRGGCGIPPRSQRSMLRKVCLGIALALLLTASAWADFVSGRVLGLDGNPVGGKTFTAEKGGQKVSFSTDKAGNFSVYLDPGTYVVHFSDDATVQGVVHGYPQSTTEDIHLTKKK